MGPGPQTHTAEHFPRHRPHSLHTLDPQTVGKVMRPHDRPRHTHGQLQGHQSDPGRHSPQELPPCKPDPRNSLPLRRSGTCTETYDKPSTGTCHHENMLETQRPCLWPQERCGPSHTCSSWLRWQGGRTALPTPSAALLPEARASSPLPSSSLGPGPPSVRQRDLPAGRAGSRHQGAPLALDTGTH